MATIAVQDSHPASRTTPSENFGTEELPQVAAESCSNSGVDPSLMCHDLWRIALYYIYIELTPAQVESHITLQRQVCDELGLNGRIRISQEGVNGVLSGKHEVLLEYEKLISYALQSASKDGERGLTCTDNKTDDNEEIRVGLDVKYCELRKELPVQKQLFDRLIVKKTQNVIGLFDQSIGQEQQRQQQKLSKSERQRRRRERKRREQEQKRQAKLENQHEPQQVQQISCLATSIIPPNDETLKKDSDETITKEKAPSGSLDMGSLYRSVMEEPLKPAQHLSGKEWNEKLDDVSKSDKSALLLDVRNVYEMKVGHFAHPSTPTLLTNTRKYSDLPQMLASNKEMKDRDQIFMYCTGGVRCERVSMLVRELYPQKEIFQLQGGIQRYLETCLEQTKQQTEQNEDNTNSATNNPGYFVGKNFVSLFQLFRATNGSKLFNVKNVSYSYVVPFAFLSNSFLPPQVFDPRRTDPTHFGETVGRCLICQSPHDDYDNGHAPSENKEARCNNCRMLVLICNDCRPNYRCHGETNNGNDSPLLYCNVDACIHEGSTPDPELLVSSAKEGSRLEGDVK